MSTLTVPDLAPATEFTLPTCDERVLANGLTVLAVRRPSVPLVELRLRIPFAHADVATSAVMSQTLFSGTADKDIVRIAAQLQSVGGALSAGADADRLMIAGNSLVGGLSTMLGTLAEVLEGATYPEDQVRSERERLVDRLNVAREQAAHQVQVAMLKRVYAGHPYSIQSPEPEEVARVDADAVRRLHSQRLHPTGATLVIVGDLPTEQALDAAETALVGWDGAGEQSMMEAAPPLETGPLLLVDRPESVQSSLRMVMKGVPRRHPDNAAQHLANLVFGGYFSSRLVANIREDKGYTYSPRSAVDHALADSLIIVSAEVATEVTAAALWETRYELGRMVSTMVSEEELDQARRYALGTLRLGTATQSGLASLVSAFAGSGLRLEWLLEHAQRLASVSVEDVARVSQELLAPANAVTVVLGDVEKIDRSLRALTPVTR
ncbi:MAG TPA: insulinase family protein [Candidatus Stackebrandtia excrementipullorum]|nr:insulinase family protein [Candidatus Stackebrandtia excrementipullorum]